MYFFNWDRTGGELESSSPMSSQALFPQQIWCFVRTRKREKDISIISATIYHDAATAHTTLSNNGRLMPAQNYAHWNISNCGYIFFPQLVLVQLVYLDFTWMIRRRQ